MCSIVIPVGNKDYEFYNVPNNITMAIVTLLKEYANCESTIISAESER